MEENVSIPKKRWSSKKSIILVTLTFSLFAIVLITLYMTSSQKPLETKGVLSSTVTPTPTTTKQQSAATPSSQPTSPTQTPKTKQITIALFGDSMIDTMGDNADVLSVVLERKYPDIGFTFYNYGIGAQNIEAGLARFESPYDYKERSFPSVLELSPDILIVGSFSYNPFNPHDPNRHKTALSSLLTKAKQTNADVYLLVEIAPLSSDFGKGEKGVNMSSSDAENHAAKIRQNLKESLSVASSLSIPVIDAYTGSKVSETEGTKAYVNPDDGIHPSYAGHLYTADQIAKTVKIK